MDATTLSTAKKIYVWKCFLLTCICEYVVTFNIFELKQGQLLRPISDI